MKTFHVYQNQAQNKFQFIQEGFCWQFLIFNIFWAAYKGMWTLFASLLTLEFISYILINDFTLGMILFPVKLALLTLLSFYVNDLYCFALKQQGWIMKNLVVANSKEEAKLRYYDKLN